MSDTVYLSVGNRIIEKLVSYSIDADMFLAAGHFSIECSPRDALWIEPGLLIKLWVNKQCEMVGIIDRVEASASKKDHNIVLSGRDLVGLLCDHCCENFGTVDRLSGKTLIQIAEMLIKNVPFIQKKDLEYQEKTAKLDKLYKQEKIDPGETVFEVLKRCSVGRGLLFYGKPDGTFAFGKPRAKGSKASFSIIRSIKDSQKNNVEDGTLTRDISQCYSKITVIGQVDGKDDYDNDTQITVKGVAFVPGNIVPYYKPLVVTSNKDSIAPQREAEFIAGKQIAQAFALEYTVPHHSQSCGNWKINELCGVLDEALIVSGKPIRDTYLIYGRTFERDKETGSTTRLRLGYPGIMVSD